MGAHSASLKVLKFNEGNVSATARQLSMHRRTLQRKLQKKPTSNTAECRIILHLLVSSTGYKLQPADYKVYFNCGSIFALLLNVCIIKKNC
jgi:hypothetical protein